jgi:hypothetical protein
MKKLSVFLFTMLFFAIGISTVALGAPMEGTWTGDKFDGVTVVLDPENDGATVGDVAMGRDGLASDSSWTYWGMNGMLRYSDDPGSVITYPDGTQTQEWTTYRSGGTFYINGENLWGHATDTIYTASIEGYAQQTIYSHLQDGVRVLDYMDGVSHYYGRFNEDPFLLDFTANIYFDEFWRYSGMYGHNILLATLSEVQMKIDPVPEPATMLLLSSGLIGLAGFGRKRFKK